MLVRRLKAQVRARLRLTRLRARFPLALVEGGVKVIGNPRRIHLGSGSTLAGPLVLSVEDGGGLHGSTLHVGSGVYIGEFCNVRCGGASVVIGNGTLLAQGVSIIGTNHGTRPGIPIREQAWVGSGVSVGKDCWIGANAVFLPGSSIGDGSLVAAGAVVKGRFGEGVVLVGAPAKVVKYR